MDPNYKPSLSLDVAKIRSRKPCPRFSTATNMATTPGTPHVYYNFFNVT